MGLRTDKGRRGHSHLSEGAFADERVDFVAIEPLLARSHNVVVVVIVVAFYIVLIVTSLLLVALVLVRSDVSTTLLLGVVHLIQRRISIYLIRKQRKVSDHYF